MSPRARQATTRQADTLAGVRTLAVVFGDQLQLDAPLLASLDPQRDAVLMMEVAHESRHVPSHLHRTVLFLAAMRHFAAELTRRGLRVEYVRLDDPDNTGSFEGEVDRAVRRLLPAALACTRPGEWRVLLDVQSWSRRFGIPVTMHEDSHFLCTPEAFAAWAKGRTNLTMEYFYREQRRATGYLMVGKGPRATPEGGTWNFDASNRVPFGKHGPDPKPPAPPRFAPDEMTREVFAAVRRVLPELPGSSTPDASFAWPVTRGDARAALRDFVARRLPLFGPFEDAMWSTEPTVYHSLLSPMLNLKLLDPRECCEAAITAYREGRAPLQSVEAFVRQIIGWREFIRGVYWLEGPQYAERNSLGSTGTLPDFYWTGATDMRCLALCTSQVVSSAYAHHIQRLMVMGNFALLAGVHPKAITDWYLGMFVDGVDWVTLPNTLGMVMHADKRPDAPPGVTGLVGTKPYAASGKYIERMSDYCTGCRYDPGVREGPRACPFNVLYWDFLIRHQDRFAKNQRMAMILKNVERMSEHTLTQLRLDASVLRKRYGVEAG